jgi:hypothetical protein
MDCPLGTTSVKAFCRKLKGGPLKALLKKEISKRKVENMLAKQLKAGLAKIQSSKRKARAKGPSKKRVKME